MTAMHKAFWVLLVLFAGAQASILILSEGHKIDPIWGAAISTFLGVALAAAGYKVPSPPAQP